MYNNWKKDKNNVSLKLKYLNYCKKRNKVLKITKLKYETEEARQNQKIARTYGNI